MLPSAQITFAQMATAKNAFSAKTVSTMPSPSAAGVCALDAQATKIVPASTV